MLQRAYGSYQYKCLRGNLKILSEKCLRTICSNTRGGLVVNLVLSVFVVFGGPMRPNSGLLCTNDVAGVV